MAAVAINRTQGFWHFFHMSFAYIFKSMHGAEKKPLPENEAFVKVYLFWKFQQNPIYYVGVTVFSLSIFQLKLTVLQCSGLKTIRDR